MEMNNSKAKRMRWLAITSLACLIVGFIMFTVFNVQGTRPILQLGAAGGVVLFGGLTLEALAQKRSKAKNMGTHNK